MIAHLASPAAIAVADRLGAALADRYSLGRELGRGGMATVYLAQDLKHGRPVAMKVLHPEVAARLGPERFQREIRVAAQLHHPQVLPVYDSGTDAGLLWFTMPCVEGETLRRRLQQAGPLSVPEAVRILAYIARALAYAHRHGVVHRDVKPENVLLSRENVFLADFGVAKPSGAAADPGMTVGGLVVGTPTYMAPEQAAGDPAADHRADLYSLGVLGYELLVGEPPFAGLPMVPLLAAHIFREPEPIGQRRSDVPAELADAIARCLRKEPADRWPSADELCLALRADPDLATPATEERPARPLVAAAEARRHLDRGRAAFQRADWREAYFGLAAADAEVELDAEDLELLAQAAWWVSDGATALRAREQAYRRYLRRGELPAAASVALALAEDYFHRLARSVGRGWLRRAERHLADFPDAPEQGWLCRLRMQLALESEHRPDEALALADRSLAIARRTGDADLEALAMQDRGRILVALGRVTEGMALIEDAMTAATAGELTPHTTGRAFCNMMSTCDRLGDVGRAAEWQEVVNLWGAPYAESGFPGICRVYRAGILRLRGDLPEAEQQATRAAEELKDFLFDIAGEAFYELGEIQLQKGDLRAADAMFTEAHVRGRNPQPGLALLRLAEGNAEAARAMIERVLEDRGLGALERAKLLPAMVEIHVACNQLDVAADAASELETITTTYTAPALVASAALARGRVELASGRPDEALTALRRAQRIWIEIELPFELARTRLLLARAYRLLGEGEEAKLEERAAQATLDRLGIGPSA